MSTFSTEISGLARQVVAHCITRQWHLATAESCTGGLIAGALTDISGSSAVVDRGFVTYSNQAKIDMLAVKVETLDAQGAVSEDTARQMAAGALAHSRADFAVAVTGIAGPGGGSTDKPVGLVHIAVAARSGTVAHARMLYGDLGRDAVRLATVSTALSMLLDAFQTA